MRSLNLNLILCIISICVPFVYCQRQQLYLSAGSPCRNGTCRSLRNCQSAIDSIKKGEKPTICSFEGFSKEPVVCCHEEKQNQSTSKKRIFEEKCEEYQKIHVLRYGAIAGGNVAEPAEFPHMALIGFGEENNIQWLCGGSLISERYVLTAAHCLYTSGIGNVTYVKLGVWEISEDCGSHQLFTIEEMIRHPDFKSPANYHDIALIKLNRNAQFNSTENEIRPACLNANRTIIARDVIASGWGDSSFGGEPSSYLMKVRLDLFSTQQCSRAYSEELNRRKLPNGILDDFQICAGRFNEEKDSCQADSGGPLQVMDYDENENVVTYIIGISSFGKACGIADVPGVYTRVSAYIPWIESIVWSK